MEDTVSGFKVEGNWADIVEHGERITAAFNHFDVDNDAFKEWSEWRPKADERLDNDINEKTAEKAVVDEGPGEQQNTSPNEDFMTAGKKLADSGASDTPKTAASDIQKSVQHTVRAVDTLSRKLLRHVEAAVYQHVMTQVSPYYFDNELVSANISKNTTLAKETAPVYTFEVGISDDNLRDNVREFLSSIEDIDRWHIDTPKDTTPVEASEGIQSQSDDPTESTLSQASPPSTHDN